LANLLGIEATLDRHGRIADDDGVGLHVGDYDGT
jgi:hypothetical protein